jgi:hypothetical protein
MKTGSKERLLTVMATAVISAALLGALHFGNERRQELKEASTVNALLEQPTISENHFAFLAARFDLSPESPPALLREQANSWLLSVSQQWPSSETLLHKARSRINDPRHRLRELIQHSKDFQPSKALLNDLAYAHAQVRDWRGSLRYAQQAVAAAPWDLRNRERLAAFFERALPASGNQHRALEHFISEQRTQIHELNTKVHERNRVTLP